MRLSSLLSLVSAVLLAGSLACAYLSFWVVDRTEELEYRITLALASYAQHADLKANMYLMFKEKSDSLLIGDRDRSVLESVVKSKIDANFRELGNIIGREIEIDAEEELEELELLGALERNFNHVVEHYDEFLTDSLAVAQTPPKEFVHLLDQDIDIKLSGLIDVALAGELEEIAVATQTAASFRTFVSRLAAGILAVMLLVLLAAVIAYSRLVKRPFGDLMAGADAYRRGSYSAPIKIAGAFELRYLATTLADMAAEIATRERVLRGKARQFEARVNERTSELQTVLTQFEQSEARRRQMLADVSHELRTPLTIIQGEAEIALRSALRDVGQASEAFSRIRDAARHTNRIVDDLLLVAREEVGQLRLDLRNVDLDAALAEAAMLAPSSVEVLRFGRPAKAKADSIRLRQCLLAVMTNALRYGGRHVRAWVESREDGFDIVVDDDGPGMSDVEKRHAFERFFRGSGAQSSGVEGTGLGLPIVRSIMAAHGGSVELADREGGGLVVRLKFIRPVLSVVMPAEDISSKSAE